MQFPMIPRSTEQMTNNVDELFFASSINNDCYSESDIHVPGAADSKDELEYIMHCAALAKLSAR